MNLHTPSFLQGLEVGRRLKARRLQRQPVAYLYNGVRLPALPEWDKTAYPYAYIGRNYGGNTFLYFTDVPAVYTFWALNCSNVTVTTYQHDGNNWKEGILNEYFENYSPFASPSVWANYGILSEDESVYLAASEPVPVYE